MSFILPDLTFYRMPDNSPTTASFNGLLTGIFNSLTGTTDYRGTTLPSTHLWTWATGAVGVTNAVYNTAIPTGSGLTRNFSIILVSSGAATPTMATPDTFVANALHAGFNTDTGSYVGFTSAIPMTSGTFSGFWRANTTSLNVTGTVIRTYVSQEAIFVRLFLSTTVQSWLYIGAIYEPYDSYDSGSNFISAQSDNRILGMIVGGSQPVGSSFLSTNALASFGFHNGSNGDAHCGYMRPYYNTFSSAQRNEVYTYINSGGEKDLAGNWVLETVTYCDSSLQTRYKIGQTRNLYILGLQTANTTTIRSGSTDLYHQLSYNVLASSQTIALKAAP